MCRCNMLNHSASSTGGAKPSQERPATGQEVSNAALPSLSEHLMDNPHKICIPRGLDGCISWHVYMLHGGHTCPIASRGEGDMEGIPVLLLVVVRVALSDIRHGDM